MDLAGCHAAVSCRNRRVIDGTQAGANPVPLACQGVSTMSKVALLGTGVALSLLPVERLRFPGFEGDLALVVEAQEVDLQTFDRHKAGGGRQSLTPEWSSKNPAQAHSLKEETR